MKVSSTVDTQRYQRAAGEGHVRIEFGIPEENGNSSAGEKNAFTEKAVRLAWRRGDGSFDPISSAELPEWAIMDIIEACANKTFFSTEDTARLIKMLSESILRKPA